MQSKTINKYKSKSVSQLIKIAQKYFNKFIRERDRTGGYFTCISCQKTKRIEGDSYHAGHLYSAGHYSGLRFDERNVHGQCKRCNYFLGGNEREYFRNLEIKIGSDTLNKLILDAEIYKRQKFKWDRFTLIEIIETYKNKSK